MSKFNELMRAIESGKTSTTTTPTLPKKVVPTPPKAVVPKKKGIIESAFDKENYVEKFKRGDIKGGIANIVGSTLRAPQSVYLNLLDAPHALYHGERPTFKYNMDYEDFEKEAARRDGITPVSERIKNPVLRSIYKMGMEIGTDPIELTPLGFYKDIQRARAGSQATRGYLEALQSGKLVPKDFKPATISHSKAKVVKPAKAEQAEVETKLLTEGVNWTEGKMPVKELPEPKIYVDEGGVASHSPLRENVQTESYIINKSVDTVKGERLEKSAVPDLFDDYVVKVFDDSDMGLVKALIKLGEESGQDAKVIIKRYRDSIMSDVDKAIDDVANTFRNYEGKGVELYPQQGIYADGYGADEYKMLRVSLNDKWYRDFYKSNKRAPTKAEKAEIGRQHAIRDLEHGGGEWIDPELAINYSEAKDMERINNILGEGLKDVKKNTDGTYSFVRGNKVDVIKPDYASAKGKVELPFMATADEIAFVPKKNQTKSVITGKRQAKTVESVKPTRSVGADMARPISRTGELVKKHGAIKQGMQPRVEGRPIPKASDYGPVQKGIRTSAEARVVSDASYKEIQSAVEEGMATRFGKTNEGAVNNANKTLKDSGLEGANGQFNGVLKSGKMPTNDDIALGYRLMQEYQAKGDYNRVAEIAVDVSEMLSEAGRSLQAAKIIKQLSPEGRWMSVQRVSKAVSERTGSKVKIKDATRDAILKAKSEKEINQAFKTARKEIYDQMPVGLQDKFNAWRYMSMLANPKTHIRNIVGNAIFMPFRETKNVVGVSLEKMARVKVGDRTKAIINPAKDGKYLKFANDDFANVADALRGNTKLDTNVRPLDAKVFKTKILEKARKLNMDALDLEDVWFMRAAYDTSMAQYLKANKIDVSTISNEVLEKARLYASEEALKATYRDANKIASGIAKAKNYLGNSKSETMAAHIAKRTGGMALEGIVPFAKTPINIIRRGIEYSPVSIISASVDLIKVARKGNPKAVVAALDRMAAGLTGSGVMLLGAHLGKQGIVTRGADFSSKEYQLEYAQGMQEYAIDTGEGTYTIDWAAPMSMPFFVGVEMQALFTGQGFDFGQIVDAITSVDEPILNMSMLQGVNDALRTYGDKEALTDIGYNMMLSYLGQYVPTVAGQVARTVDDTRRTAVSTKESAGMRKLDKFGQRQVAKIPIASKSLDPYVDLWGRTESSKGAVENFLSPGFYRGKNITKVDERLNDLIPKLDKEQARAIIPRKTATYSVKYDKKEYRMTTKEFTRFKETRGQESYRGMERLFNSSEYRKMTNDEKVKAIGKVYDAAYSKAKEELVRSRGVKIEPKVENEKKKKVF